MRKYIVVWKAFQGFTTDCVNKYDKEGFSHSIMGKLFICNKAVNCFID